MFQSIYFDRKTDIIHLWDDKEGYTKNKYTPYGYVKDPKGEFKHINGFNVSKTFDVSKRPYEYDVPAETRFLVDKYYTDNSLSENISTLFFDIELEKGKDGYSTVAEAKNKINAISFYSNIENISYAIILDETGELKDKRIDNRVLKIFNTEKKLLAYFLKKYIKYKPNILVGWNSDLFDIPYTYQRLINLFGKKIANKLSPLGIVKKRAEVNGTPIYKIAGVASFDYMELYKTFTFGEEPSYSLDAISRKELGRGKVEYEGNLDTLYKTDINKFIEYSFIDTELMIALDEELDFISLARSRCHKTHVPYDDIYITSKVLEGGSLTYMKINKLVAPNKPSRISLELQKDHSVGSTEIHMSKKIDQRVPGSGRLRIQVSKSVKVTVEYTHYKDNIFYLNGPLERKILQDQPVGISLVGAFVKDPIVGLHKWVFDIDLTSLYPSIIRTLNISTETKHGRIVGWNLSRFIKELDGTYKGKPGEYVLKIGKKQKTYNAKTLKKYIDKNNLCYAANGVLYNQDKMGFIPTILGVWFDERVEYKDEKKKWAKAGDLGKAKYFHNLQLVQKTLLNSFYGVMALQSFRFYDIDNAEAVTSSGQQIIKFSAKSSDVAFEKIMGVPVKSVLYVDTDSVAGDSMLRTKHGEITIDKYFNLINTNENTYITDVTNREFIFPKNEVLPYYCEKSNKVKTGNVEYVERHKVKKRMFNIKSKKGKSIKVTEDHSLMVLRNKKLVEVKPLDLKISDKIIKIK